LLSSIASLTHEGDFVKDRLMTAPSAEKVLQVMRTGKQAALDWDIYAPHGEILFTDVSVLFPFRYNPRAPLLRELVKGPP
jgi:hypothetical protein